MPSRPKQAVVLIHGIGEQVPMDTLRGFVDAVWITDPSVRPPDAPSTIWSKPDKVSDNFELRRLTTVENLEGRRTDFFEFYWANFLEDTTLTHVGAWVKVLLLRWPWHVPRQLRGIWWFVWSLGAVIGALVVLRAAGQLDFGGNSEWWVGGVLSVIWLFASGFLIHYAGDAARYLHVAPPNIESRRKIREAGMKLLQALHASDSGYDRVIVVGHSLGTAIGFDLLRCLWSVYHDKLPAAGPSAPTPARDALEELAKSPDRGSDFVRRYQEAQAKYHAELRAQGNPWLVTDFVTIGSPLAHAEFLMARGSNEFARKKFEREYPCCPPELEGSGRRRGFTFPKDGVLYPHHAAVFAPTRWTNIFFPARFTVIGDVIGGPVAPMFGDGIRDISVETSIWGGLLSHTHYWSLADSTARKVATHLLRLREVVRIVEN